MLKILWNNSPNNGVAVKIEGRMLGQAVGEVRRHCERFLDEGRLVTVDMSEVLFLDRAGLEVVKQLMQRGVRLVKCTAFVTELLKAESDAEQTSDTELPQDVGF